MVLIFMVELYIVKSNSSTKKNGNVYLSNDSFDEEYYLNPIFNFENFIVGNNNESGKGRYGW